MAQLVSALVSGSIFFTFLPGVGGGGSSYLNDYIFYAPKGTLGGI